MDRFEADLMDDLMADAAEGPSRHAWDDADEMDAGDDDELLFDADEADDRLAGRIAGGAAGADDYDDEFDAGDEDDAEDAFDAADDEVEDFGDDTDAMEELVADAMDAEDGAEYFARLGRLRRRLGRLAGGALRVARRVGRGVGQAARAVGPIASLIPLPQAQAIARIANIAGRLLADGADEFELFDDFVDGLDEDGLDAAAPVLAGMVIRRALPAVARAGHPARRAAVRAVTQAVRTVVRRQGPPAARAVARAVRATRRIAQRQGLPARQAVQAVRSVVQSVARRPQTVRRLARPLVPASRRVTPRGPAARAVARVVTPIAAAAQVRRGGIAPVCRYCQGRHLSLRAPVTITVRGR